MRNVPIELRNSEKKANLCVSSLRNHHRRHRTTNGVVPSSGLLRRVTPAAVATNSMLQIEFAFFGKSEEPWTKSAKKFHLTLTLASLVRIPDGIQVVMPLR